MNPSSAEDGIRMVLFCSSIALFITYSQRNVSRIHCYHYGEQSLVVIIIFTFEIDNATRLYE